MNQFNHFLLTKFNVASFDSIFSKLRLTEEYLNYRFELFDKFCYSSVKGQTNQNFKWIVLFDVETPDYFRRKIQTYAEWDNFIPIYLKTFDLEEMKNILSQKMVGQPKYLITTTLDNDDAIAKDYIQMIQDNFREQEFELINFLHGYMWQEPSGKIYSRKNPYLEGGPCNPFISLIESSQSFKTVWGESHNRYCLLYYYNNSKEYKVEQAKLLRQVKTKPAWLQVIHGTNQYNRINGIRQSRKNIENIFLIKVEHLLSEENYLFLWLEQRLNYFLSIKWVRNIRTKLALKTRLKKLLDLPKA